MNKLIVVVFGLLGLLFFSLNGVSAADEKGCCLIGKFERAASLKGYKVLKSVGVDSWDECTNSNGFFGGDKTAFYKGAQAVSDIVDGDQAGCCLATYNDSTTSAEASTKSECFKDRYCVNANLSSVVDFGCCSELFDGSLSTDGEWGYLSVDTWCMYDDIFTSTSSMGDAYGKFYKGDLVIWDKGVCDDYGSSGTCCSSNVLMDRDGVDKRTVIKEAHPDREFYPGLFPNGTGASCVEKPRGCCEISYSGGTTVGGGPSGTRFEDNMTEEECDSSIAAIMGGVVTFWKEGEKCPDGETIDRPDVDEDDEEKYISVTSSTFDNPLRYNSIPQVIGGVILYILRFIGALALLMFVIGGMMWLTSGGNSTQVEKGRNAIVWAAIGLIVVFFSYILVKFLFEALGV